MTYGTIIAVNKLPDKCRERLNLMSRAIYDYERVGEETIATEKKRAMRGYITALKDVGILETIEIAMVYTYYKDKIWG